MADLVSLTDLRLFRLGLDFALQLALLNKGCDSVVGLDEQDAIDWDDNEGMEDGGVVLDDTGCVVGYEGEDELYDA